MGLSISTTHQDDKYVNVNELVYASSDLNLFHDEYKHIHNSRIIDQNTHKPYKFHKYMIINENENYVNINRYLESYSGDCIHDIMHTYIKYDILKTIDFNVVMKLPRSRKRQQKNDHICRSYFNKWKYTHQCKENKYDYYETIHNYIKKNNMSLYVKTLLHDHDQFCTSLAYGYPIIIEKACGDGYTIMLIVGYNKYKKEYILKTPYALQDQVGNTLMYISFDSIMKDVIGNCILYSKMDINKLLF